MAINRYYLDELSYLRELGARFAAENPRIAPFLAREADDPDVERLMEGFAFLTAKLREKLDDELPEIVHTLLKIIWPQALRPIPPMTMLTFAAQPALTERTVVPRDTVVHSRRIQGITCPFTTCFDTPIMPFEVKAASVESTPTVGRLTLTLGAVTATGLLRLADGRLRLHLGDPRDPQVGPTLMLWLLRHVRKVTARTELGTVELGPDAFAPGAAGFDEAVIPYPSNAFQGFRLLQEYLHWPARFQFVDVDGLRPLAHPGARELKLTVETTRPFPESFRLSSGQIRLNCTPAINLFRQDGVPIAIDRRRTDYRVVPIGKTSLYSVNTVVEAEGFLQGAGQRRRYLPFESFEHAMPTAETHFFRTRQRPAVVGSGIDTYVAFGLGDAESGAETITPKLLCSNGPIAEAIPIGHVDQSSGSLPAGVLVGNSYPVLGEVPPPVGSDMLWRLVSGLSRNYGSFVDVRALRGVIASYDFRAVRDAGAARRLELLTEAITRCSTETVDMFVAGAPVRGRRILIEASEAKMGGLPDLFVFGSVLDAFFTSYASINSLHALALRGIDSNTEFRWKPRAGAAAPF